MTGLDGYTLFAANAIILFVMAGVFHAAGHGRVQEVYWHSWRDANLLLGAALVCFLFEARLPDLLIAMLPNGLLVVGFGLRWQAAREFSGRSAPKSLVLGPVLVFLALCCVPWIAGTYGSVYTIVNVILTVLAWAVAWEFWRDRDDGYASRIALVGSYGLMGASFAFRVGQGMWEGAALGDSLPYDTLLVLHLVVATIHTTSSGGFALSLAHERDAAGLKQAASEDFLTGLLNRGAFETRLQDRLHAPGGLPFALVLLDIDHFKRINDEHGHAAGDAALRTCASAICDALREGDFVGRIGGEEFAVVLDEVTPAEARAVTERLRRAVAGLPMEFAGRPFRLTISAGVCHSSGTDDFDVLMRNADAMLYAAKSGGRNRVMSKAAA